jgi:hypothetical protein
MKVATAELVSASPYSQSRHYDESEAPKKPGELSGDYEVRTWRHRMHVNHEGLVEIPPMSFANALKEAAKRRSDKIKGSGQKTYTKKFEAGVMVTEPLVLPMKAEDVPGESLFVPSDGIRGSGKRVTKIFSRIDSWAGSVRFFVFDDVITEDIFMQTLKTAGMLVGIGRFRPERLGYYGRFNVKSLDWREEHEAVESAGKKKR